MQEAMQVTSLCSIRRGSNAQMQIRQRNRIDVQDLEGVIYVT